MELPVLSGHPSCDRCELHSQGPGLPRCVGMAGIWLPTSLPPLPENPAVYVLGQNPGLNEDKEGEPFVGFTGKRVRQAYLIGPKIHELATIYLGNAVRCFTVGNAEPPAKALSACAPWTAEDLHKVADFHVEAYILCMGSVAIKSFLKHVIADHQAKASQKDAFRLNGLQFPLPSGKLVRFYGTYHPMAAEHQRHLRMVIIDHINMMASHLRGTQPTITQPTFVAPRYPRKDSP